MSRVLLLVDLSYQSYRSCAANPNLRDRENRFTGGIYGFFQSLAKSVRETGATDLVVCQDRKPYLRSIDYPEYKQLRKKAQDPELKANHEASMPKILEALAAMGIRPWGIDGFESDDMAGYAARKYRGRFDRIYAASNDSDLFQLMDEVPNFSLYAKDIATCWNAARLRSELGMTAEQYTLATALQGTHNDIAGIPGVGEVTARKAAKDPALLRKYRASHGDVIDRNLALIRLPHPRFPGASLPENGEATPRDMYRALGRHDIEVTGSMVEALMQVQRKA